MNPPILPTPPLPSAPPINVNPYPPAPNPRSNTSMKTIIIVVSVVLFFALLGVISIIFLVKYIDTQTKPAVMATKQYIAAMDTQINTAAKNLESPSLKQRYSQQQLDSRWNSIGVNHQSYTLRSRSVSESNGVKSAITNEYFSNPENPGYIKFELAEINGQWLITNFSASQYAPNTVYTP